VPRPRLSTKDAVLLGLTLCAIAVGGYLAWSANVDQRVFIVNGLDVATEIAIDGRSRGVPAGGKIEISLHRGIHRIRVTGPKAQLLEEGPVDIPSVDGAVAYNILGAAPLYTETVVYGTGAGSNSPSVELHAGKRLVVSPHADFVFVPAPRTISVESSSASSHTRRHFDRAAGGWETTTRWLEERGDPFSALRISLAVAEAEPTVTGAIEAAAHQLEGLRGPQIAIAYLRQALETRPDDFDLHRLHQHLMRRVGQFDEARAFYRSHRERYPQSALAAVLLARVEALEPALELSEEALAIAPQDKPARRGLGQLLFDAGRFAESIRVFDEVARTDPDYKYYADDHVRALLHVGNGARAMEVASAAAKKAPNEWGLAVLYAELALTQGVPATGNGGVPESYVDGLAQKRRDQEFGLWMRSLAGLPVQPKALSTALSQGGALADAARLQLAAEKDPAQAWTLLARTPAETLERLAPHVAILLAAEFFRAGDTRTADRLFASRPDLGLPADILKSYIATGTEHPELWRLPTEMRAVLDLVRARKLQADGSTDRSLYASAVRREAYLGLAGRAIKSWPAPEPTHAPASLVLRRRSAS
jgi:tetratricopeptide (TPR) repeat protein